MGGGVSTIPSGYYNQYGYGNNAVSTRQMSAVEQQEAIIQAQKAETLSRQQALATQQAPVQAQTADGKDDGKIGFWQGLKNFGKGVGNFFKGMVCDENGKFSLKRTLTTLVVAAGAVALTVATGGAAAPFLVAAGATIATVQTGKGIYKACTAKTDREAEAAWQDIGTGVTGIAMSVAGAKGALKSAGVSAAPKGNAVTSVLRATGECFKIAGKGSVAAAKGMLHPMQSARAISGYWSNTMKPNLQQAFSWKTAQNNYDAKGSNKSKISQAYEEQIQQIEAKLYDKSGNIIQNSDTQRLQNLRNSLYDAYDSHLKNYGSYANKNIIAQENYINGLKAELQNATGAQKTALQTQIKESETLLNALKTEHKIDVANAWATRGDNKLAVLKEQLASATTDAQKAQIQSQISAIESSINGSKNFLRLSNAKLASIPVLKQNGLAIASYHLSGARPQTMNDQYAQIYGFGSLAEMEAYATQNGLNVEQFADYLDMQYATQGTTASQISSAQAAADAERQALATQMAEMQEQQAQQSQQAQPVQQFAYNPYQNPYMQNPYAMNMFNAPTLDFNSLYVSPYPAMI